MRAIASLIPSAPRPTDATSIAEAWLPRKLRQWAKEHGLVEQMAKTITLADIATALGARAAAEVARDVQAATSRVVSSRVRDAHRYGIGDKAAADARVSEIEAAAEQARTVFATLRQPHVDVLDQFQRAEQTGLDEQRLARFTTEIRSALRAGRDAIAHKLAELAQVPEHARELRRARAAVELEVRAGDHTDVRTTAVDVLTSAASHLEPPEVRAAREFLAELEHVEQEAPHVAIADD